RLLSFNTASTESARRRTTSRGPSAARSAVAASSRPSRTAIQPLMRGFFVGEVESVIGVTSGILLVAHQARASLEVAVANEAVEVERSFAGMLHVLEDERARVHG